MKYMDTSLAETATGLLIKPLRALYAAQLCQCASFITSNATINMQEYIIALLIMAMGLLFGGAVFIALTL